MLAHLAEDHTYYGHRRLFVVSSVPGTPQLTRHITIAFRVVAVDSRLTIEYGTAYCSEKDQFIKEKGRMIAAGRLKKRPTSFLLVNRKATVEDIINYLTHCFLNTVNFNVGLFPDLPDGWRGEETASW